MNILKLKKYREKANLTQLELSKMLNVTQSHYSRWENGSRIPDAKQILKLCEVLSCSPNDLFGFRGVHATTAAIID